MSRMDLGQPKAHALVFCVVMAFLLTGCISHKVVDKVECPDPGTLHVTEHMCISKTLTAQRGTCHAGSSVCMVENATCTTGHCTTVDQGGGNCVCQCK